MGGWIASETFDHTSTLQFLEQLTGVTIRTSHVAAADLRRLSSASAGSPRRQVPRLPDTKAALAKAVFEVNNLPAPVVPTTDQVLPVQHTGPRPRPRRVATVDSERRSD